jgi:MFS family permease
MFVGALVGGQVADKIGYRGPNTLAMLLMFVVALALMIVDAGTSEVALAFIGCISAAGVGIGFSTTSAAGMAAIEQNVSGEAAGVINVARYLGTVLVVALGTIIMMQVSESRLTASLDDAGIAATETIDLDDALSQTSTDLAHTIDEVAPDQQAEVQSFVADATVDGFRGAQIMTAIVMLGATIASWVLLRGEKARAPAFPHRGPVAHAVSR